MKMTWIQSFLSAGVKALPCAVLLTTALAATQVQAEETLKLEFQRASATTLNVTTTANGTAQAAQVWTAELGSNVVFSTGGTKGDASSVFLTSGSSSLVTAGYPVPSCQLQHSTEDYWRFTVPVTPATEVTFDKVTPALFIVTGDGSTKTNEPYKLDCVVTIKHGDTVVATATADDMSMLKNDRCTSTAIAFDSTVTLAAATSYTVTLEVGRCTPSYHTYAGVKDLAFTFVDPSTATEPACDWSASFNGNTACTGWFTSWDGEAGNTYAAASNGLGYRVAEGSHPYRGNANITVANSFSLAMYADISDVEPNAILMGVGGASWNGGSGFSLVKTANDEIAVLTYGANDTVRATLKSSTIENASFVLYTLSIEQTSSATTFTLTAGSETVTTTLSSKYTPTGNGLQVGSCYGGSGYIDINGVTGLKAINAVIDEMRGYNRALTAAEVSSLVACFPTQLRSIFTAAPTGTAINFSEIAWNEGTLVDNVEAVVTLADGATLTVDTAPALTKLTVKSTGSATVIASGTGSLGNVAAVVVAEGAIRFDVPVTNAEVMAGAEIVFTNVPSTVSNHGTVNYALGEGSAANVTIPANGYIHYIGYPMSTMVKWQPQN